MITFERNFRRALRATMLAAVTLAAGLNAPDANAALALTRVPVFLNTSVDPNIILTFDDSGSMLLGYVPNEMNEQPVNAALGFPATDTRCWWLNEMQWAYSAAVNTIYYDPTTNYTPPVFANGTSMPNVSFTNAPEDGIRSARGLTTTFRNLATGYRITWGGGSTPNPDFITYANPSSTCDPTQSARSLRFPFGKAGAFYYRYNGATPADRFNRALYTAVDVTVASAAEQQNFANWFSYYRTRNLLARSALLRSFDGVDTDIQVTWQGLSTTLLTNSFPIRKIEKTPLSTHRTNFYNFLMSVPATGGTPSRAATRRVGEYIGTANADLNDTNPYFDPRNGGIELACRQNFHLLVTDGGWKDARGLDGDFDTQTFTLPDGRVYDPNTQFTRVFSNEDSRNDHGYADNAFYYWSRDARPGLADRVPAFIPDLSDTLVPGPNLFAGAPPTTRDPRDDMEIYFNPANDPATWQHLVQYVVAFGLSGTVGFPTGITALRRGTTQWPYYGLSAAAGENGETVYDGVEKVDDTWHGALNARGDLFSADNPDQLISALNNVFASVRERTGSTTPVTVSQGLLTEGALAYRTGFDTSDWSGNVIGLRFGAGGGVPIPQWDAACLLTGGPCDSLPGNPDAGPPSPAPAARQIITSRAATGGGIAFRWGSLTAQQQTWLNLNPQTAVADGLGNDRLDYIRGERRLEQSAGNGGNFRDRTSILGSVVNSAAEFVGRPKETFDDSRSFETGSAERGSPYSAFVEANKNRQKMIYVGANDGMLHAFDATTGREQWAYVPFEVFPNLNKLTSRAALNYQSYVDATPVERDVFVGGAWRTVLLGALRLGGQGVYALDVTNPGGGEGVAGSRVLWEFSDNVAGGNDLGYTFGTPFVTRLANRRWAALVPAAYNADEADGSVGTLQAVLFVLDMENGALLRKFVLPAGTQGLTSIIAGDYRPVCASGAAHICPAQGQSGIKDVTDVAFAGDLSGDMWRFNFDSVTPAAWSVEKFFDGTTTQPITASPNLAFARDGRVVVLIGTGKYLEATDATTTIPIQTFYGLFDQGPGAAGYPITRAQLLRQTLSGPAAARTLTTLPLDATTHRGWYFDFLAPGERHITIPTVRRSAGQFIFTTLVPQSNDPCLPNLTSFLIFGDVSNGGITGSGDNQGDENIEASFDVNGDGRIDESDDSRVVAKQLSSFLAGVTPVTLPGGGVAQILLPGDTIDSVQVLTILEFDWRQRSWRSMFIQ